MKKIKAQIELSNEQVDVIARSFGYQDEITQFTPIGEQELIPNPVSKSDYVETVFTRELVDRFSQILTADAIAQIQLSQAEVMSQAKAAVEQAISVEIE